MITLGVTVTGRAQVTPMFSVCQNSLSQGILKDLHRFFGCGRITEVTKDNTVEFQVRKLDDILNKIIPHFEKYPLVTSKALNFESLKEAALMVKEKRHLTTEGLSIIKDLKFKMNTGRSFEEKFNYC